MVSVSQAFEAGRDLKALLKRVLQAGGQGQNGQSERHQGRRGLDNLNDTELATKLNDCLEDKRYC
jgi:hypothetical protein